MRAVVQRVSRASVRVEGAVIGEIGPGLCVLVGAGRGDTMADVEYLADKVVGLRLFEDAGGKMNLSAKDVGGAVLAVSQFTLYGDARKGRRPSFVDALEAVEAERLVDEFVARVRAAGVTVATGRFRATMDVELVNRGPVTLLLDSRRDF